ncbi:kinase-like domain-containing protein, partial [Blyttiomyces helicus]
IPVHGWWRDKKRGFIPMEAHILRTLDHEGVVKFFDLFEDSEFFYLVMECAGTPFVRPDENSLPPPTSVFETVRKAAEAPAPLPTRCSSPARGDGSEPTLPHVSATRNREKHRRESQDLFECIERNPGLSEGIVHRIFVQVARAVAYMHESGFVHRDIKDENIVVDSQLRVKLIDLGCSAPIPRTPHAYFKSFEGTLHSAAPEALRGEPHKGPQQDVWALGVLLYTLAFGCPPFRDPEQAATGVFCVPMSVRSNGLVTLLRKMLCVELEERCAMGEVLEHEWVVGGGSRG